MIIIDFLKNHTQTIPALVNIWYEVLGKIWIPDVSVEQVILKLADHLNDQNMPITLVALEGEIPIGMCSLCENDGIRPDLAPWLGPLVVAPEYQKQGIGKMLVEATVKKAEELGFEKLYLFAFDPIIPKYYQRLGWEKMGMDECKSHPVTVMTMDL